MAPSPRSRTRGWRTLTGPIPVWMKRSGRYPLRTTRRRPAASTSAAWLPKNTETSPQRLGPTTRELQLVGLPSTDLSENQMGFEKQQRYSLSWRILPWLSSSGDINNHQDTPPSFQRRTQDSVIAPACRPSPVPSSSVPDDDPTSDNHSKVLASIDFFVLPTATFRLLMVFIVLHHERRQSVHFGVTAHPTAAWVVGIASVVIGVTGRYWA